MKDMGVVEMDAIVRIYTDKRITRQSTKRI